MLLLSHLKVAAIASLAQAYVIPKGTLDEPPALVLAPTSRNTARDALQEIDIYCGCGHNMNPGDTDAAVDGLKSQLPVNGPIRPPNGANNIHSISGGVVAFICLGGYKPNIYVPDYTLYLATITNSCGRYVAGTYRLADHGGGELRYFDAGYMNNYDGLDFCRAASGSSTHKC